MVGGFACSGLMALYQDPLLCPDYQKLHGKDKYKPEPTIIDDLIPCLPFRGKLSHPHIILLSLQRLYHRRQRLFLALLILKVGLYIPYFLLLSCLSERYLGWKAPLGCKHLFPSLIFSNVRKN